jgi:hypothetical protein
LRIVSSINGLFCEVFQGHGAAGKHKSQNPDAAATAFLLVRLLTPATLLLLPQPAAIL